MARRRLEGLERVLGANALFSTAYGNVGSSIYYALGPRRLLRAGPDAGRLRDHRRVLLHDRRDLRGGDLDVPGGGRLVELRAPRLQRVLVVLRRLGADAHLHDDDRDLRVLRPALHRRAVLGGAALLARRHHRRRVRDRRAGGHQRPRGQGVDHAQRDARGHRLPDAGAAGADRRSCWCSRRRRWSTTSTSASRRPGATSSSRSPSACSPTRASRRSRTWPRRPGTRRRRSRSRSTACGSRCSRSTSRCRPSRCRRCRSRRAPNGEYLTLLGLTEEEGGYAGDPILGVVKQIDLGPLQNVGRDLRRPARRDDPLPRHQRGPDRRLAARLLDGHPPPAARPPAPAAPASTARRGSGS